MAEVFGLDFGATNSLAALVVGDRAIAFADEEERSHPSAVVYRGDERIVGRQAKLLASDGGSGDELIRSPKSSLGSGHSIRAGGANREPAEVAAEILKFVRQEAQSRRDNVAVGSEFDRAVITIPVEMDGRGRRELRRAATSAGIATQQFIHEPLAALYGYLREQPDWEKNVAHLEGKLILVFDWGGGTLDLTLCRVTNGTLIQVQNRGENRVGGDLFDTLLRQLVIRRHQEQFGLTEIDPLPGGRSQLLDRCEQAKISLSQDESADVFVANFLRTDGPATHIHQTLTRSEVEGLCKEIVSIGLESIDLLLDQAAIQDSAIELVLATGGMVQMPLIRRRLEERFGIDRVPLIDDGQQIIAKGAAWIANDQRFLRLAKPFELLLADDNYMTLYPADNKLPLENQSLSSAFGLYCVDPRDGYARFQFARPLVPGRSQPSDRRVPYYTLLLPVSGSYQPVAEQLNLSLEIDHDLVVHARVSSELTGDEDSTEIHGLEFGLSLTD